MHLSGLWGKGFPSMGNSKCKGPEAGVLEAVGWRPQRVLTSSRRPLTLSDVNRLHRKDPEPAVS